MARGSLEASGSNRQVAREQAFRLLAVTVAALFLAFASLGAAFFWYDRSAAWVSHTHVVRNGIADVLQGLTEVESAQRGYILTGDPVYLAQVEVSRDRAESKVNAVDLLTADNRAQQSRIVKLRTLMNKRLAVVDETIAQRRSGDAVAAITTIRKAEGLAAMDGVRQIVAEIEAEEAQLLAERAHKAILVRTALIALLAGFAAALAVLFIKSQRDIILDREAEAENAEHLRGLLADRTLLLDEVNHRVKNSLQQIASVVRLQSRSVSDDATRQALETTLDRIMAVGRVHEQLYKAGGQVGIFDAGAYAKALAHELVEAMGREDVVLTTQIEPHMLDLKQAVPMALILNELVTNALKYGCPADRPCRLRVGFGTEGENYRLSVSDDGVGLPKGFTTQSKASLGMRAIEALARQLDGRFVVEKPEVGAAFAVLFPRSQ